MTYRPENPHIHLLDKYRQEALHAARYENAVAMDRFRSREPGLLAAAETWELRQDLKELMAK